MRNGFLLFIFLAAFSHTGLAIDASVSYASFKSPDKNYIEIYLNVIGKTVEYVPVDADSVNYKAGVEVIIILRRDSQIVKYDKYNLNSPVTPNYLNFIDLRRYALDNGQYDLEVSLHDLYRIGNAKIFNTKVDVNYNDFELKQSDIQLLASYSEDNSETPFVKNGYYLETLPFNFYGKNSSQLIFYNEIYNAEKAIGEPYWIRYMVEKVVNGKSRTMLLGNKGRTARPIDIALMQMDISKLPSGNYNLVVEVRSRTKELLSSKTIAFQRSNPFLEMTEGEMASVKVEEEFVSKLTAKELAYSLRAIRPVLEGGDVEILNIVLSEKDSLKAQRQFLFNYWAGVNPNLTKVAYEQYMKVADAVDATYKSGFGFGFETDRGYTFLRYGKPDDMISVEDEPSAPPYEIWIYNDFPRTKQRSVKFLFYNPSLGHNDYVLLHSNAIGEIQNPNWEAELYRDAQTEIVPDPAGQDGFNRNAVRYFNDN